MVRTCGRPAEQDRVGRVSLVRDPERDIVLTKVHHHEGRQNKTLRRQSGRRYVPCSLAKCRGTKHSKGILKGLVTGVCKSSIQDYEEENPQDLAQGRYFARREEKSAEMEVSHQKKPEQTCLGISKSEPI